VKTEMTTMLESDEEFQKQVDTFEITARVKEPYSMWKKMLRLGYDHVLQVPDALALRVVLKAKKQTPDEPAEVTLARERALCYYAQKLCQDKWKPVASNPRFKDYIGRPKANGYQSLHYTAQTWWEGEPWTLEVQVRSAEMHSVAEIGLASHWDYKASQKRNNKKHDLTVTISDMDHSSDAYLRKVQQWHWTRHGGTVDKSLSSPEPAVLSDIWQSRERADRIRARTERLRPYLQALTTTQSDLVRERLFVFLTTASESEGKVLALPSGACVLDALREGERALGVPLAAALVNGQDASITKQLHNGDILKLCVATATVSS
jgi:(p)ppGpp synthase/HD superfamily hydrolase